ncbi:hypothetical protein [Fictibacillus terranigra]|uniref:Uncharacterized protein n=1 Tax=Fictibacillus terranigra TaxID=3058424 RepID=A0ABT8E7V7_9BACL|nr:hypothetical protein [Fictibacillus sp. CENA-BCM004]MDN4074003.1 hypothetical protein [Fictibacillus sp. CENA-BCM004]
MKKNSLLAVIPFLFVLVIYSVYSLTSEKKRIPQDPEENVVILNEEKISSFKDGEIIGIPFP